MNPEEIYKKICQLNLEVDSLMIEVVRLIPDPVVLAPKTYEGRMGKLVWESLHDVQHNLDAAGTIVWQLKEELAKEGKP